MRTLLPVGLPVGMAGDRGSRPQRTSVELAADGLLRARTEAAGLLGSGSSSRK